jgi:uncharacterized protein YndB with AHSA1/START domain
MATYQARITEQLPVPPQQLFALISDVDRLPEWNAHIPRIVDRPDALTPGAQWVVRIRASGAQWDSRSTLERLDRDKLELDYRSQSDDGNPSYALWRWRLTPVDGGTRAEVVYEINPKTFFRRNVFVHLRRRQLPNEVRTSLVSAGRLLSGKQVSA